MLKKFFICLDRALHHKTRIQIEVTHWIAAGSVSTWTFWHRLRQRRNSMKLNCEKGEQLKKKWICKFMSVVWKTVFAQAKNNSCRGHMAKRALPQCHSEKLPCEGKLAAGKQKAVSTKFLWISFSHPRPGWCVVFTLRLLHIGLHALLTLKAWFHLDGSLSQAVKILH